MSKAHRLADDAHTFQAEVRGYAEALGRVLAAVHSLTSGLHVAGGGEDR